MFASVIPAEAMRGFMGGAQRGGMQGGIQFPLWLGKNSSTTKTDRLLGDLRNHMCLRSDCPPYLFVLPLIT